MRAIEKRTREATLAAGALTAAAATAVAARRIARRGGDQDGAGVSRAYRLSREEPVAHGLRRIARGRVDQAVERLRDPDADDVAAIHGARKDLKKLRSVLRLVRPSIGEAAFEHENERYREAARMLSGVRDDQAIEETIEELERRFDESPPGGWGEIREAARGEPFAADVAALRRRAAEQIAAGRRQTETLALPGEGAEVLRAGIERSYARGRKRFAEAAGLPDDKRLHEWRKRAKDLSYDLRLVSEAWPETLEPLRDQAHELSDLLGDDHDLALLAARLDRAPAEALDAEQRSRAMALISERRVELQRDAFARGERLYGEKPKAFAARIAGYWDAPSAG